MPEPGADLEALSRASALVIAQARDMEAVASSVAGTDDPESQLIQLGVTLESLRAARRALDDLMLQIAEVVMARGAGPRFLDWNDGTDE